MKPDTPPVFGGFPETEPALFGRLPEHTFRIEWHWLRPLRAILDFLGYSIDEVVSDPRAAAEVRVLWDVYKLSRRLARDGR